MRENAHGIVLSARWVFLSTSLDCETSAYLINVCTTSVAESSVRWYAIGDWGDYWFSFQHRVADAMAEYAETFVPEFILALGDNFYQEGIHSVDDPKIDA